MGSPQETWLRNNLQNFRKQHPHRCILAFWHRPLYSSSVMASSGTYANRQVRPFWQDLFANRAAVVLNGHYHGYERFRRQNASGKVSSHGIREFVVATGGAQFYNFRNALAAHSAKHFTSIPGVLQLRLRSRSYSWAFYRVGDQKIMDSGSGTCPQ